MHYEKRIEMVRKKKLNLFQWAMLADDKWDYIQVNVLQRADVPNWILLRMCKCAKDSVCRQIAYYMLKERKMKKRYVDSFEEFYF